MSGCFVLTNGLVDLLTVLIVVPPRRLQILPHQAGDGVEHFGVRRPQIPSLDEAPHGDARVANTGIAAAHARRFRDPARELRRIEPSGAWVGILGSHGCSFLPRRHYTSHSDQASSFSRIA